MLELLESIDDDLDRLGVGMVKISETSAAKYDKNHTIFVLVWSSYLMSSPLVLREWGIQRGLGIVYFESGVPFIYQVLKGSW